MFEHFVLCAAHLKFWRAAVGGSGLGTEQSGSFPHAPAPALDDYDEHERASSAISKISHHVNSSFLLLCCIGPSPIVSPSRSPRRRGGIIPPTPTPSAHHDQLPETHTQPRNQPGPATAHHTPPRPQHIPVSPRKTPRSPSTSRRCRRTRLSLSKNFAVP